jgi:small subunit ribosomal protein S15
LSNRDKVAKIAQMITTENKAQAIKSVQTHKTDVGSPQVQASVLTTRIKEITAHLKENKHDNMARRGLIQMVGKRKRLLKYLERKDFDAYTAIVAKLGLRK